MQSLQMHPTFEALSKLRRHRYEECTATCRRALHQSQRQSSSSSVQSLSKASSLSRLDKADRDGLSFLLLKSTVASQWVNETEAGGDAAPSLGTGKFPGMRIALTALGLIQTDLPSSSSGANLVKDPSKGGVRKPVSLEGRPVSGFARPPTAIASRKQQQQREKTGARLGTAAAKRMGTARLGTAVGVGGASGYLKRLATQQGRATAGGAGGGVSVELSSDEIQKYSRNPATAKEAFEWLVFVTRDPWRAFEFASDFAHLGNDPGSATAETTLADWWWLSRLGSVCVSMGLSAEAIKFLSSSVQREAVGASVILWARALMMRGQDSQAISTCETYALRLQCDVSLLVFLARLQADRGEGKKALALFKRVLKLDPLHVEAQANLACNFFYEGHAEVAAKLFSRIAATCGRKNGGVALHSPETEGKEEGGEEEEETELTSSSTSVPILCNLAVSCLASGQWDSAVKWFEKALQVPSTDPQERADLWFNLSHLGLATGDLQLATQALRLSILCQPDHGEALNNLSALERRAGRVKQASLLLEEAVRVRPTLFEPLLNRARAAERDGNVQTAIKFCQDALKACPDHSEALEFISDLREQLGML
uniref:Uncharacterized protein n=1 Tax=Chromera velia CCMP2878 TaxID=1169474 RepID=A0A0G4FTA0_9ALVE|eukprot:Cvel_18608.t1-p1 / transcript=Cvel_18608.t1 / gene=Cvel_18608 / organism=Chromera_velia_CCMP2878 / gene_product=Tetratricopeptide repeat protein 8, putative / transcript_product=Tetratricopeptide repeat protein 8, putative / location=Cvel_scaffold1552:37588-41912(+) / protein_length=598 / sequence_SO=supercontig / SO=protein_coding / is_pseudo=false